MARIAKTPDSTAKLEKLLNGQHRLNALVVLAECAGELPEDVRERCWMALAATAKEMATQIERGNKPGRLEVLKLINSTGAFWVKLGPTQGKHMADLAVVRKVVVAAAAEWDKPSFSWADQVLAAAGQGQ